MSAFFVNPTTTLHVHYGAINYIFSPPGDDFWCSEETNEQLEIKIKVYSSFLILFIKKMYLFSPIYPPPLEKLFSKGGGGKCFLKKTDTPADQSFQKHSKL